jgi:hypothetical protein
MRSFGLPSMSPSEGGFSLVYSACQHIMQQHKGDWTYSLVSGIFHQRVLGVQRAFGHGGLEYENKGFSGGGVHPICKVFILFSPSLFRELGAEFLNSISDAAKAAVGFGGWKGANPCLS